MGPSLGWDREKEPFPGGIVSIWGYGRLDYMHLGCSWVPGEKLAVTSGDGGDRVGGESVAVLPCLPNLLPAQHKEGTRPPQVTASPIPAPIYTGVWGSRA